MITDPEDEFYNSHTFYMEVTGRAWRCRWWWGFGAGFIAASTIWILVVYLLPTS